MFIKRTVQNCDYQYPVIACFVDTELNNESIIKYRYQKGPSLMHIFVGGDQASVGWNNVTLQHRGHKAALPNNTTRNRNRKRFTDRKETVVVGASKVSTIKKQNVT